MLEDFQKMARQKDYSFLSIILATYQEKDCIEENLTRCVQTAPGAEIVVVDDSLDNTREIAKRTLEKLNVKKWTVHKNDQKRGKGYAVRVGIGKATLPIHAHLDADSQYPPEKIPRLIEPILNGQADITFCSRFRKEASHEEGAMYFTKALANRAISLYTSLLSSFWLTDIMAGFKAWKADAIRDCDIRCDHFGFEGEIAVMAGKRGYKIIEIPIHYSCRAQGKSKVSLLRDGWLVGSYLLKVKLFR